MTIRKVLNRRALVGATVVGMVAAGASGVAVAAPGSPAPPAAGGTAGTPLAAALKRAGNSLPKNIKPATPRALNGAGTMAGVPSKGTYAFLLQLNQQSTMTAYNGAAKQGKTAASAAAKSQYSRIQSQQASVESALPTGSTVLYRSHSALAGVAVLTDVHNLSALQHISGVQAVYPVAPKTTSNSNAIPFQFGGAANVWPGSDLGANSSIAIIDTGIDYTHANFGGPGTTAVYDNAKAHDADAPDSSLFPNAKVVGGTDLAGDDYNADPSAADYQPTPRPDTNPLDCGGHGSHVAGSAAGYGENADGTTYTGAYNSSTPFTTMRIGPGMAPKAKLYAFKVFGCDGSTNLVGAAIDKALDPNGDGDTSDHVNVINMSLGSDFGSPQDGDSVEANNAAAHGITVAVASGNGGDYYDVGGSPGNAQQAIAVANSVDAVDLLDTLHVTAPSAASYAGERSVAYDWATKPDLAGQVAAVSSTDNKDGCDPITDNLTGKIAFLDWTSNDPNRRCGSAARAANAKAAGAIGFIFGADSNYFSAGITGSADIPGVMVVKDAADAIRAQLAASTTVTVGSTSANDNKLDHPGNNDLMNVSSSRGMRGAGSVKPDVTAVGTGVFSTAVGTGTGGVSESGTSMATPMVAGLAALVNSAHPTWTAEQVKADIMNTAGQDLDTGENHTGATYGPNRVGAGRIMANAALNNSVLAYVQDDPGAVSVSFGPVAVTKAVSATKTVKVVNTGTTSASYLLSYKGITTIPGVNYTVSPSSITVPAGQTVTFTVTLSIPNPKTLTKTLDSTMDRTQGVYPREFLADASGRVVLAPTAGASVALRVPVYSAPRPASSMTEPSTFTLPQASVQKANVSLTGTGVNQGSGDQQVTSTVAGFELQLSSPAAPTCSATVTTGCVHFADERSADLRYVGVTSDAPQLRSLGGNPLDTNPNNRPGFLYFAVNTQGAWRTPAATQEFDIYIDTNGDNKPDAVLFNTRLNGTDVFADELVDANTGALLDVELIDERFGNQDMALYDSDTMVMPVALPALPGLTTSNSRIRYGIASFSNESAGPIDLLGIDAATGNLSNPRTFDALTPGLVVYGSYNASTSFIRVSDQPGFTVVVRRDTTTYFADQALGALMVHFHNGVGSKAQAVTLKSTPQVSFNLTPGSIKLNSTTTTSTHVIGTGPTPTGKVNIRHVGGGVFATGTLSGGRLSLKIKPGSRGRFSVRAEYLGDANYAAANSGNITLVVT